jgi:phage gp36-like protein
MPYITHAELAENPGALELCEVASDEHAQPVPAPLLDALLRGQDVADWAAADVAAAQRALARIDAAVADAGAVIDGYLAKRGYALPLQPVHRLVTTWARDIARHTLHKNRLADDGKDPIQRAWRDALRLLQQVADGRFALSGADTVAVHKTQAMFDSAPLVFGRKQLRSWR